MRILTRGVFAALIVAAVSLSGCAGEPLRADSIQLGRSLNSDGTVGSHTTTFGPNDTVYAAVVTSGAGKGTIGVRWTYAGRVMGEPKKEVNYRDAAATEFHLQSAGGFPPGDYSVEAFLNGQSAGTRAFRVTTER